MVLSRFVCLGFIEGSGYCYGLSVDDPQSLVFWEVPGLRCVILDEAIDGCIDGCDGGW